MTEKILLKDLLFNCKKITLLAKQIKAVYPDFLDHKFCAEINLQLEKLELKQRIVLIAEILRKYLPKNYKIALKILLNSLPAKLDESLCDGDFGDFIYASYSEFVAQNGCDKENLSISFEALKEITKRFSAEYAIRIFINNFSSQSLDFLTKCSLDKNYHVRRLASEGLRPNLPWGKKIIISYKDTAKVLENLYFDSTRFVTRSTANHLNDIAKIDADFVINILQRWQETKKQSQKEMDFITRHALRNLVKQGNKDALKMLGFNYNAKIVLSNFVINKKVMLEKNLNFSFMLQSDEGAVANQLFWKLEPLIKAGSTSQRGMKKGDLRQPHESVNLVVDYVIYFCNEKNALRTGKVFKLKNFTIEKNKAIVLTKKHKMAKYLTTRRLYKGKCKIEIKVNGQVLQSADFLLA